MIDIRAAFQGEPLIRVRSAVPHWVHLEMTPAEGLVEKVAPFIRQLLAGLPEQPLEELSMAVEELLSNSMEHGCRLDKNCRVDLKYVRMENLLMFQVSDAGEGFSVEDSIHAAINNPPEEPLRHAQVRTEMGLRPGGFGILLARKVADELIYNELGNEVILVKYLAGMQPVIKEPSHRFV